MYSPTELTNKQILARLKPGKTVTVRLEKGRVPFCARYRETEMSPNSRVGDFYVRVAFFPEDAFPDYVDVREDGHDIQAGCHQ